MRLTEAEYARLKRNNRAHVPRVVAPTEQEEQEAVIVWARAARVQYPALELLAAIPNGEKRDMPTAMKLKAAGVSAGIPDLVLCCQRRTPDGHHYGALFVEMKRADRSNHPTPAQLQWHERLRAEGYLVVVAYGANAAIEAIEHYLMLEPG